MVYEIQIDEADAPGVGCVLGGKKSSAVHSVVVTELVPMMLRQ